MKSKQIVVCFMISIFVVGCAQSRRQGLEILCTAWQKVTLSGHPAEDAKTITDYIVSHVKNKEVLEFYSAFGGADREMYADVLAEDAKKAGLSSCSWAEHISSQSPISDS